MVFVQQMHQMAMNAMRIMAEQVQELQERFRLVSTERVERRLERTLIRLSSQAGCKIDEGILIDLPLTRQDLAEMTGTTLFTVSRILSAWEEQGLVISKRERVILRSPHGLIKIIEDTLA
jgi:CRP/FNR family transcriptional regulator, nitrogen oxide reductase regulator